MPSSKTGQKRTSGPVRRTTVPSNGTAVDEVDAAQLKRLLASMKSMRDGNFRRRLPVTGDGTMAELSRSTTRSPSGSSTSPPS